MENENNNTTEISGNAEDSIIVSGDQSVIHIHKTQPDDKSTKNKISFSSVILSLLIVGIVSASAIFFSYHQKNPLHSPTPPMQKLPRFVIENPILRSDAVLIIKAANESANRKEPLSIEFDGLLFGEKGIPADSPTDDKRQYWRFSLIDQQPPPERMKDGEHRIRAGFTGEDLVKIQEIVFHTQIPIVRGLSYQPSDDPDKRVIEGKATSKIQSGENKLAVEMLFFDEGEKPIAVDIPVRQVRDPKTGTSYYEFQTTLEGLPKFSSDDPRYGKPFFGLKITDQAGNDYYQQVSYAQYIAPGDHHFGSSDLADITVEKQTDTGNRQVINLVRLTKRVDRLPNGETPIKLKVTARTVNSRQLEWKSYVDVKATLALVYRDEKQIGVSTKSSYVDNDKLAKDSVKYRVEQEGKDGNIYVSNTENFKKSSEVLLTVKSNVREDTVHIDGEKRGTTPLNLKMMTGKHSVRVEKPSYATFEQEIDLQKDQTVTAKLEPAAINKQFTNSFNMKFVYIRPGTFMMGSSKDEIGHYKDETKHKVTLTDGFYIQITEVTQRQWKSLMNINPSFFSNCGDDCPVENIGWDDVQMFIDKLNREEKTDKYRLPTEAEWEYAARAGKQTAYSWGKSADCSKANYGKGNSKECDKKNPGKSMPVMSFAPNNWGLYDMHGNVWEWCQDRYGVYPSGAITDPVGPNTGESRVNRGGSWNYDARYCRSANRRGMTPNSPCNYIGFRLVRSL